MPSDDAEPRYRNIRRRLLAFHSSAVITLISTFSSSKTQVLQSGSFAWNIAVEQKILLATNIAVSSSHGSVGPAKNEPLPSQTVADTSTSHTTLFECSTHRKRSERKTSRSFGPDGPWQLGPDQGSGSVGYLYRSFREDVPQDGRYVAMFFGSIRRHRQDGTAAFGETLALL